MLKTSQLEIFEAVVECGSVNKAAETLHTSQPYISRVLKNMEEEMGKVLLLRNNQGVIPTRDGKFIYSYAKSILSGLRKIDEMKNRDIHQLDVRLEISLYSFFIKDRIFVEFAKKCVSDHVLLSVREGNLEQLVQDVQDGTSEVGIAVINDIEYPLVHSTAVSKNIKLEIVASCPLYVHLGPSHEAYQKETVNIKDLLYSTYVHIPFDQYSKARLDIEIDGHLMREFKQTMAVNNYHLMPFMVKETDSFMFGNQWQIEELSRYGISSKRIENTDIKMHFVVFTKKDKLSAETKKILEMIQNKI